MRKAVLVGGFCVLIVAGWATSALAEDRLPPPWDRAANRATFQQWEFNINDNHPLPDVSVNPYGTALCDIVGNWLNGAWMLAGVEGITVQIPNSTTPLERKELWIQITWETMFGMGVQPDLEVFSPLDPEGTCEVVEEVLLGPGQYSGDRFHTTYHCVLEPNPDIETVIITAPNTLVDELVIDTICIPEPATMGLLAMGAGLFVVRRKRR